MVYNSKKFPGMMESSELSKTFARQGVRIPIRNEVRSKRCKDEEGGGDTTPDEA